MAAKELAHQHAVYSYGSFRLTLMYSPTATAAWEVYDGGDYLGLIEELHPSGGVELLFRARIPSGEESGAEEGGPEENGDGSDGSDVTDWRVAVEILARHAGL